ncbi:core-2/I-branching enzyme-domain-containing protein [Gaertneriomyces semiglobifer]|nr:core-2/I-branching enzyme-domain-containing protein [Gaertneriomyces semiglobifer]
MSCLMERSYRLEAGTIDVLTHIHDWNATVSDRNPTLNELVSFIDEKARALEERTMNLNRDFVAMDVHRFACYYAIQAANPFVNMSTVPLLHRLDSIEYFAPIMPAIKSNSLPANRPSDPNVNLRTPPNSRKKYQMAYLLTLHDPGTFTQSIELIRSLNDTSALFLIHISLQSSPLHERFTTYLLQYPSPNVHLSQTRYNAFWGHVSIVHMQLSGFFELLDLGEWKYVINLSGHDWPLRTSQQIYESLEREGYKWRGWEHIQKMGDINELPTRLFRPHFGLTSRPHPDFSTQHPSSLGLAPLPFPNYKICKQHQWMILTRGFIEYLRSPTHNVDAMQLLAFYEHTWIPDESWFCTVRRIALNSPFSDRIAPTNKRFVRFRGAHPDWLHMSDSIHFPVDSPHADPQYFFIRKVDILKETELKAWILREHVKKQENMAENEKTTGYRGREVKHGG